MSGPQLQQYDVVNVYASSASLLTCTPVEVPVERGNGPQPHAVVEVHALTAVDAAITVQTSETSVCGQAVSPRKSQAEMMASFRALRDQRQSTSEPERVLNAIVSDVSIASLASALKVTSAGLSSAQEGQGSA